MTLTQSDNFLYRFLKIAEKYPNNTAVIENNSIVTTYNTLLINALKIAAYLQENSQNEFVGISLEKSAKYLAAILGCWFAKKAFIPVGTSLPENRKEFILNDAGIDFVFGEDEYKKAIQSNPLDTTDIDIENNKPAYIIYTSGSTGKPKGVIVSHNGIVNLADCQRQAFEVDNNSRYLFYLSINFDASISDISVCLLSGAALIIETESALNIASSLVDLIQTRQITHIDIPPSLLKLLDADNVPKSLKTIVIGGEACDIETVKKWAAKVNLVNVYGPTEATVCTSLCKCSTKWKEPLLGVPIKNTEYKIFDDGKESNYGELYISGVGLALGYVNNKNLTEKKFVFIDGVRYYKTGDLVEKGTSGEIKFLGRIDRQVKIRGQLVELEEIENRLNLHPNVYRACVIKRPLFDGGSDALVAFVELKEKTDEVGIKNYLKGFLPAWMIPAHIEFLNKIPITSSEKVDFNALNNYEFKQIKKTNENITETEKKIVEIFKRIIGVKHVGLNDNFFDLGGSSLDALELIFACKHLGISLNEKMLSQGATPEFIANYPKIAGSAMAMDVDCLKSDILFEPDFEISQSMPTNKSNVLITGATGFLGSALLSKLLFETDYTFYCIVRAKDEQEGLVRLQNTFSKYQLKGFNAERIKIVCADISKDNFGLSEEDYKTLSKNIFRIYHCAATVNMLYPYEKLKNINLDGTKRVLKFACTGILKELHYASTLSVFVSTDKNTGTVYENDNLDDIKQIWGGYGQTKFAAEKYLLDSKQDNVFIYRFGLICGDTMTGISSDNDFLNMFVKGAKSLKALPYDKTEAMAVDITPVDFAVKSVVKISESNTAKRVFHIANKHPLMYNDFIRYMEQEKIIQKILDYESWHRMCALNSSSRIEDTCISALCRMDKNTYDEYRFLDLFQATDIVFNTQNAESVSGLTCPKADEKLIKKYLSVMEEKCLQV